MKIKYYVMLAALGMAFAVASVWVFLSRGENAKAVRMKFRLGGMMLTITSMLSLVGCEGSGPGGFTCYDPPAPHVEADLVEYPWEVHTGDTIRIEIIARNYDSYKYDIRTQEGKQLQEGELVVKDNIGYVVIDETDYLGDMGLYLYGLNGDEPMYEVANWWFNLVP